MRCTVRFAYTASEKRRKGGFCCMFFDITIDAWLFLTPYVWTKSLRGWRRHLAAPWVTSSLCCCDKREGNVNLSTCGLIHLLQFWVQVGRNKPNLNASLYNFFRVKSTSIQLNFGHGGTWLFLLFLVANVAATSCLFTSRNYSFSFVSGSQRTRYTIIYPHECWWKCRKMKMHGQKLITAR